MNRLPQLLLAALAAATLAHASANSAIHRFTTLRAAQEARSASAARNGYTTKSYSDATSQTGYGFGLSGYLEIPLTRPTTTEVADTNSILVLAGARCGSILYFIEYNTSGTTIVPTNLYKRDINTGETSFVTAIADGAPIIVDMAYSSMTGKMYCLGQDTSGNEALYTIGLDDGKVEQLGATFDGYYYALAADRVGMLYAVTSSIGLVTINPLNAYVESVGGSNSSYTPYYISSMDYDLSIDALYWALCNEEGYSYLIKIDPLTGTSRSAGKIGSSTEEVVALNVSLEKFPDYAPEAVTDLAITPGDAGAATLTVEWTNPSATVGGTALDTLTTVQVSLDGTLKEEITSAPAGAKNSITLTGLATGYATISIVSTNGSYTSDQAAAMAWVGVDIPREPSNIELTRTSGSIATLSWDPPTDGVHGGYMKTSSLKYRIVRFDYNGDSTIVAKTYKQDNCYLDSTITSLNRYHYKIQSLTSDYGMSAQSDEVVLGLALTPPYSTTFSSQSDFALWETLDNNGDGTTWDFYQYNPYVYHKANSVEADDWLISPPLGFETDSTYYIYVEAYTGRNECYTKHFQITVGTDSDPAQNPLYIDCTFGGYDTRQTRIALPVTASGEYRIGIRDISAYSSANLRIPAVAVQTKHTAWLAGTVADCDGNPIEGVTVEIVDDNYNNLSGTTAADGSYTVDFIEDGSYTVLFSKTGWVELTTTATFAYDSETALNATLTAIPSYSVSGTVTDDNGDAVVNARIILSGYGDDTRLYTDSLGQFSMPTVYENTYCIDIEKVKFTALSDSIHFDADTTLTFTIEPKILAPGDLNATAAETAVTLSWSEPCDLLRHDDGTMVSQLGLTSGDEKTVNGAVFRTPALLKSMSWMTTSYQGPHEEMNLWVFDITEDFKPTNTVLFNAMGVAQEDEAWNCYQFPDPVECPRGFFLGVSYTDGMSSLATDTGTDEEYPFLTKTNYSATDYTTNIWECKDDFYIKRNHLIRATGVNLTGDTHSYAYQYRLWRIAEDNLLNQQEWTLITDNGGIADTTFTDDISTLESGNYYYAVEAVYPSGTSDPVYSGLVTVENSGAAVAKTATSLTVAPIPASETLYTSMECDKIEIITLGGQTALTATWASSIDVSALAPGTYLLRATIGGTPIIKRITIK